MENKPKLSNLENISHNEIYKFMTSQWQHQNLLSYQKLNMMMLLEVAALSGAFVVKGYLGVALLCTSIIVSCLLYLLMLRDWELRDQHIELLDKVHEPLNVYVKLEAKNKWRTGRFILKILLCVLLITNLIAVGVLVVEQPVNLTKISSHTNTNR